MNFDDQINTATRKASAACEKARSLEAMVTRAADGVATSAQGVARMNDTFAQLEVIATGDVTSARDAMTKANTLLVSGALGGDVARVTRSLNTLTNNIERVRGYADQISDGAQRLASLDLQEEVGKVGGKLSTAVAAAGETLGALTQRVVAAFAPMPSMVPANIEFQALGSGEFDGSFAMGLPGASSSQSHLLILTSAKGSNFYFNLSTAGFGSLRRSASYNIASQERLTRRPALQAVSKGGETIMVTGAIFTKKGGAGQLNLLRAIGFEMSPVVLTTGYGEALGQWYLNKIDEEQEALFADGMPRKQQFTLEFQRYGEDYSDV